MNTIQSSPKWFTTILNMAVPTVGPVDCATPYKVDLKHEFDTKDSHLRVEDNLSKRFEVDKRPALVTDSVSEKNDSSKYGKHCNYIDFERQFKSDQNFL